jgi:hypothetical protein
MKLGDMVNLQKVSLPKLSAAVIYEFSYKGRVCMSRRPFQTSLMCCK